MRLARESEMNLRELLWKLGGKKTCTPTTSGHDLKIMRSMFPKGHSDGIGALAGIGFAKCTVCGLKAEFDPMMGCFIQRDWPDSMLSAQGEK